MVLNANDVLQSLHLGRRRAAIAPPEVEMLALKNETFVQSFGDLLGPAEILVIACAFAGEEGVNGVMEVIAPDRINAVTSRALRPRDAGVVCVGLSDYANREAKLARQFYHVLFDVGESVSR